MIDFISCTPDGSLIRLYDEHHMRPVCETNDIAELANAYLEYGIAPVVRGSASWFNAPWFNAREYTMKKVYEVV